MEQFQTSTAGDNREWHSEVKAVSSLQRTVSHQHCLFYEHDSVLNNDLVMAVKIVIVGKTVKTLSSISSSQEP